MIIEWVVVIWLLGLATVHVLKVVAVDAYVQITAPERPPPSLVAREKRQELAQKQAATTGAPGVGQAIADRLANFIANPPRLPAWVTEFLSYLALLLSDQLATARRRHAAKQRDRERRDRGEQPRTGRPGEPYCWRCDVNHVRKRGDLCDTCTPVVKAPCPDCSVYVPVTELRDGPCAICRIRASATDTPTPGDDEPGPARLVLPAWLAGVPETSAPNPGPGHHDNGGTP
jgi:hypothetical protein